VNSAKVAKPLVFMMLKDTVFSVPVFKNDESLYPNDVKRLVAFANFSGESITGG
jgi:hypothetical protein